MIMFDEFPDTEKKEEERKRVSKACVECKKKHSRCGTERPWYTHFLC
jgi:hypothetical protein